MSIKEMNGHAPENIEALILQKGMKKKAVAEKAGLTAQEYSGVMAGRRILKISELLSIAGVLGVEPNDILRPAP